MPLNPDAIPTSEQVRETFFDQFYYPYQKQIWAGGTVLALAIVGFLAVREYRVRQQDQQWSRRDVALAAGRADRTGEDPAAQKRGAEERVLLLQKLLEDFPHDAVTPYALNDLVTAEREAGRYDEAVATLGRLRSEYKDFILNTEKAAGGPSDPARSLADRLEAAIRDEQKWAAETTYVHPQPSTDELALVETTAGSFWLGFYKDQAPEHVANFIALAKSGYFNGTQVFQIRSSQSDTPEPYYFSVGSAASRYTGPEAVRDPGAHDKDEPTATIEPEDSRFLIHHLRGVITASVMSSGESAHRFSVVTAAKGYPQFDGQTSPFAAVLLEREKSGEVIDRIGNSTTYNTDPTTRDDPEHFRMGNHPYPPIWVRRVTIWRDEKLEDGHPAGIRERAGRPDPEPWESTLPPPPKPSEFAPKPVTPTEPPKKDEPKGDEEPKTDDPAKTDGDSKGG